MKIKHTIFIFIVVVGFCFLTTEVKAEERLYYIHQDHLGSTALVTDEEGIIVSRQTYYPYGATRSLQSPDSNFQVTERQYTGQVSDADQTGLYYYNARYYNPQIAIFTQAEYTNDLVNRYSYVGGNPIINYDPTGQSCDNPSSGIETALCKHVLNPIESTVDAGKEIVKAGRVVIELIKTGNEELASETIWVVMRNVKTVVAPSKVTVGQIRGEEGFELTSYQELIDSEYNYYSFIKNEQKEWMDESLTDLENITTLVFRGLGPNRVTLGEALDKKNLEEGFQRTVDDIERVGEDLRNGTCKDIDNLEKEINYLIQMPDYLLTDVEKERDAIRNFQRVYYNALDDPTPENLQNLSEVINFVVDEIR